MNENGAAHRTQHPAHDVANLLQHAADTLWETVDRAGLDSPLHSLALGSTIAAALAAQLAPASVGEQSAAGAATSAQFIDARVPVAALETAEHLLRDVDPSLIGSTELRVMVIDLLREARGYVD